MDFPVEQDDEVVGVDDGPTDPNHLRVGRGVRQGFNIIRAVEPQDVTDDEAVRGFRDGSGGITHCKVIYLGRCGKTQESVLVAKLLGNFEQKFVYLRQIRLGDTEISVRFAERGVWFSGGRVRDRRKRKVSSVSHEGS